MIRQDGLAESAWDGIDLARRKPEITTLNEQGRCSAPRVQSHRESLALRRRLNDHGRGSVDAITHGVDAGDACKRLLLSEPTESLA